MATELAQAYVQIIPSAEGIAGNLTNLLGSEAESAGATAGGLFSSGFSGGLGDIASIASSVVGGMVDAIGSVASTLADNISGLAEYGDGIDKISQKLGISAEAYQEWDFIAQHSGTSMSALTGSFKTLSKQAQAGSDSFEKLGLSLDEVGSMSTEELFGAVIEGLQGMEEGTERTALASELLGRGATELGALFNTTAEETAAMKEQVHELGGVLSDEAVKDAAAYQDSLQNLTVSFDGLKNGLVSDLLPGITQVMDGLTAIVTGDKSGLEGIKNGINDFVTSLSSNLGDIIPIVSDIVLSLGDAIIENTPMLIEAAGDIIMKLVDGLLNNLPKIIESGLSIIIKLAQGITDNLPTIIKTATSVIIQIAKELTNPDTLVNIIKSGIELILALIDGVLEALPELLEAMPVIIDNVVSALLQCLPLLIDAGFRLFTALLENLPQIIELSITATLDIVDSIINQLIASAPDIAAQGFDSFMAFLDKIPEFLIELKSSVKEIVTKLVEFFTDNSDKIKEVGKNLVDKIWEGIKDAWAQLKTDASGLMNGLVDDLKGIWNGGDVIGGISNQINSVVSEATPTTATVGVMGTYSSGTLAQDNTPNDLYNLLSENLPIIASGRNNTVILEGDADGLFNVVRAKNNMYIDTTKYNPLVSG